MFHRVVPFCEINEPLLPFTVLCQSTGIQSILNCSNVHRTSMRLNIRTICFVLSFLIIICTISFWTNCSDQTFDTFSKKVNLNYESSIQNVEPIDCLINGNKNHVDCLIKDNIVYIPFSFLKSYFEIYGKIVETVDNKKIFHWSHSYSKIYHQRGIYDSKGVLTNFQNYKVEERDRVKCVSASDGVPVSTQWNPRGYYYPTQIAQFGLSHYSKNLTLPPPNVEILEDGQLNTLWNVPDTSKIEITFNNEMNSNVIYFVSSDKGISLKINNEKDFFISFDIALSLSTKSSILITLKEMKAQGVIWNLYYTCSRAFIYAKGYNIYHGMHCKESLSWKKLTRNLLVDLQKGLRFLKKNTTKIFRSKYKLCEFKLFGVGYLDNLTVSSSDHISLFYAAAHWFIKNQDTKTGGWPNPVIRKISPYIEPLKPGWLSAMGQGQAISLLSRAFYHSGGDIKYLKSAQAALKPFKVLNQNGGVLSKFMNLHSWYEEYPTIPPIFILNGFMYSLIGLYDLISLSPNNSQVSEDASLLWSQGMTSLKTLLPLFDMGSRSVYDLRHVTLNVEPNIARWDYHVTHINQLLLLATLDNATVIKSTAKRWINYMDGKRSSHN